MTVSGISLLAVRDISLAERFLLTTFGKSSFPDSSSPSSSSSSTKYVGLGNNINVLLINSESFPSLLQSGNHLVVAVDNIDEVVAKALAAGGKVVEESVISGSQLYAIQGPAPCDIITLVVTEKESSGDSNKNVVSVVDTISTWCMSSLVPIEQGDPIDHCSRWVPPPGSVIPTIFPSVLHNGQFQNFNPNSTRPVPFRTEYFEGEVLLLVRTTPIEPRFKHIFQAPADNSKKSGSITFEVQCQGRFLKQPEGVLYIGAEITKKMNLGMLTRGLCYTVLQFVNSINPFIHSSFGDNKNAELPHITGPLWSLADKVVVTPPGEVAPELGYALPENKESRAKRRSNSFRFQSVDLNSTYSFSVNTENIELCDWNMVRVPLMNTMDLHTFWDDADIRLCCYCVPSSISSADNDVAKKGSEKAIAKSLPKLHLQASNQYLLCVQIEHLSNHPGRSPNSASSESPNEIISAPLDSSMSGNSLQLQDDDEYEEEQDFDGDDNEVESVFDDSLFFDTNEGNDMYFSRNSRSSLLESWKLSTDLNVSNKCVFNLVPAAIDVSDVVRRRSLLGVGTRRELYLFCVPFASLDMEAPSADRRCLYTLQSFKEFSSKFHVAKPYRTHSYSRMSKTEQRRVDLQFSMENLLSATSPKLLQKLRAFFNVSTHSDYFLIADKIEARNGKNGVGNPRLRSDLENIIIEGYVCFRHGQTHWSEEYLCVTSEELIFIEHSPRLSEKKRRKVPLEDVLSVKVLSSEAVSFSMDDCYCMLISTFPREYCVLVRGVENLNRWMSVLPGLVEAKEGASKMPLANSFKQLGLFSHSKDWKLGTRVLLNGRKHCGRGIFERPKEAEDALLVQIVKSEPLGTLLKKDSHNNDSLISSSSASDISSSDTKTTAHNDRLFPLMLVQKALQAISGISEYSSTVESVMSWDDCLEKGWVSFLDMVSFLPCIDLQKYDLSSDEKVCLLLNLYHTLLLHAVLVAGVPSTVMKWPSFFNSFSYEAFGDVFSLSELEHSVIKGGFSTNGLIPQIMIRQSEYEFKLTMKDFRLLFALNCGSLTMPHSVPVFNPNSLHIQLDNCTSNCIQKQLSISRGMGKMFIIRLPLLCQWYENDIMQLSNDIEFSSEFKKSSRILRLLFNFCSKEQKDLMLELITNSKSSYSFKYSKFDFRCRILRVENDDANSPAV